MMAALGAAWQAREPRERAFLAAGVTVVAAALIYVFAIDPLWVAGRKAERDLPQLRRESAEMASLADTAKRLKAQTGQTIAQPAAALLSQTAARFGLSPQVTAGGEGGFEIQLNRASMAGLGDWLTQLQSEQHLFVREAQLSNVGEGVVSGRLALAP
jgi:general secretion pathway protein M